ncbi:MAG TPA: O-unit flippase Wzx, partial [Desulfosporosinus sp.]|nr:O-unit flippase Wzx [Desulfosporosinus sp.]
TELYVYVAFYWVVRRYVYKLQTFKQLPIVLLASLAMGLTAYFLRHLHPLTSAAIAGTLYLIILISLDNDFRRIGGYLVRQVTSRLKPRS